MPVPRATPGGYLLPRIIGLYSKAYPEVRISLIVADTSQIIDKVLSGRIEAGVVGAKTNDKLLEQTALIDDEMRLVVPADHPWARRQRVKIKELLKEPFIVRELGSGTLRSIEQQLQNKGYAISDFKVVAEMGSTEAVRQAVKNKVGLSILSTIAVADEIRSGQLKAVAIEGLSLRRSFYLTTHRQRTPSPLCRSFIDFLKREIPSG